MSNFLIKLEKIYNDNKNSENQPEYVKIIKEILELDEKLMDD
ncbi:MAG: hypothetical protein Q7U35_03365 [Methanobacteriaceae archaeon]|nr:hypothetical protein [Methanobacteriaceae archaeon]